MAPSLIPNALVPSLLQAAMVGVAAVPQERTSLLQLPDHVPHGSGRAAEGPVLFLAVVTTAGSREEKRMEARATWMRDLRQQKWSHHGAVRAAFFVGVTGLSRLRRQRLEAENRTHGDIFALEARDSYLQLVDKSLSLLRWLGERRPARFVMKIDDDTYPHLDVLVPRLLRLENQEEVRARETREEPRMLYAGLMKKCNNVRRWWRNNATFDLYSQPKKLYKPEIYPTYARGSAYILSMALAVRLGVTDYAENSKHKLVGEDVTVAFWIDRYRHRRDHDLWLQRTTAPSSNLELPGVRYVGLRVTEIGCHDGDLVSMNLPHGQASCVYGRSRAAQHRGAVTSQNGTGSIADGCCSDSFPAVKEQRALVDYCKPESTGGLALLQEVPQAEVEVEADEASGHTSAA
eukprot:TRINITY_DN63268_c1_g1_i1.p1 TRINITY_DN63268_c1_g1~~TRINITY_DN63268_c1_g1_i1.p1  ORF type:complete len:414 (-),score=77.79 TRINITY_DN63268_c1_g1_i1:51-1262(-)